MPGNQSDSIDALLGKKRESEPAVTPETSSAENVTETSIPKPETTASESVPKTLAEQISGREAEVSTEAEGPSGATARAATAAGQITGTAAPIIGSANLQTIKALPQEEQVKILTEMVMTKGLEKALTVIRRLQNPYLYDLLHDTLVDELYQRLKGPKLKE